MMRKIHVILFSILLFSAAQVVGHDNSGNYDHGITIAKSNATSPDSESILPFEPVFEEEIFSVCMPEKPGSVPLKEIFPVYHYTLPVTIYFGIWLPPDVRQVSFT